MNKHPQIKELEYTYIADGIFKKGCKRLRMLNMNKFFTIIGVCCILPIVIIAGIWFASNRSANQFPATPSENLDLQGEAMLIDALSVGAPFPDFTVTEVDGRTITKDSLKGKPAIIWFTTSWCVPCQIGAKEVSRLDKELGEKAFEVLVIFVDLRESNDDLIWWRNNFANTDWMVTFDNELTNLAKRIHLKFLDSKFILDKNGVVKNIDFKIVDQNYLNIIREIVKANQ